MAKTCGRCKEKEADARLMCGALPPEFACLECVTDEEWHTVNLSEKTGISFDTSDGQWQ